MPVYAYQALNKSGRTVRGVVDAETAGKARQRLRAEGLHPIDVRQTSGKREKSLRTFDWSRLKPRRRNWLEPLAETTRQAATLLSAGLPLVTVLSALQEQTEDQEFRRLLALIREEVQGGESFAGAIGLHKNVFPIEYIHLVRAGEMAGELDTVLNRLADDLEGRMNRRARIRAALAYPAFMSVVGVSVVLFLLTFIVPTLVGLFENLEAALPWPTRILLAVSGIMHDYWWLVLPGVVAVIMFIRRLFKNPARYRKFEVLVFRLGPIGSLIQKMRLARAFRSLAIMLAGGVPLTTALNITAQGLGRSSFGAALENAAELVGQGRSLTEGLEGRLFPPVARRMISVGESSGSLDVMLDRVAKTYEDETDRALSTLTSLVEPAIILFMGVLVLFIVLAVLLPIFDLSGLVG